MMPFFFGLESGPEAWTALSRAGLRRGYPVFEHIIQYCDPALVEELLRCAVAGGMICASFEAYLEDKEEWLRDLNRILDDLLKCVDFISVAADLDLNFHDGSIEFVSIGYAGRFSRAWGPQPQVRRTVGDVVWQAAWLQGGGAGGADFAGVLEGGGGFVGDVAEDDVAEDDVAEDDVAEDDVAEDDVAEDDVAEEVLSGVEELGSYTVDDIAELFDDRGVVPGAGAVAEDGAGADGTGVWSGDVSAAAA
jgi:hypothetical protein